MTELRPPLVRALPFATVVLLSALAGCTHVSLKEQPQVLDWSTGTTPRVTQVDPNAGPPGATYVVRRDDTLASIAARFNTTPTSIAAWNDLGPNPRIRPDQVLRVAPPGATAPIDSAPVATTQPIGTEGVEARPIGSDGSSANGPPPASEPGPTPPMPSASNAPLKTGPSGVKRPYSEATLAELARQDAESVASISPSASTPQPPAASPNVSFAWPVAGTPGSRFNEKTKGIDIAGKAGDPVLAAADGRVTFAGTGVRGYGNFVIVQHSPELLSVYAHNRANLVREGTTVTKGQKIAEMGSSDADGVKLHFEIRRDSKPVDPLQYLPPR